MRLLSLIGMSLLFVAQAQAASFQGQTQFTAAELNGRLHVVCRDSNRQENRIIYCRSYTLDPFEAGYFTYDTPVMADKVKLRSERADGKIVEKESGYNSELGRSDKRFNLWIVTLFQTPLLDPGLNNINYQLFKYDQLVTEGQVQVQVNLGAARTCPDDTEFANNETNCEFLERFCDRYFYRHNYCQ